MKVRVSFTIDVDIDAWDRNFGTGTERVAVREDAQQHAEGTVVEHFRECGLLLEEEN